ncbi:MAG TPA: DUF4405 domain-containing protein [Rubellimicrobium sp.]|nr:DUF4405 domain-containing protein [Rubellimicrobium sp.]
MALFLGVGQGLFHELYEVLSLVLILPFALHVWKNWRALAGYLGRPPMTAALALSAVAALAFALGGMAEGGPAGGAPQFAFAHAMLANSPAEMAPLLGTTPSALVAQLGAAGFTVTGPDKALSDIASASGRDEFALVSARLPAGA